MVPFWMSDRAAPRTAVLVHQAHLDLRSPADAHIINAEKDECWFHNSENNRKIHKLKGNVGFLFRIAILPCGRSIFHLLDLSGSSVCVPPTSSSYSPSHMIIFKSRAAYTMNIRPLCMVINPITHTHKCTAPSSRYRS